MESPVFGEFPEISESPNLEIEAPLSITVDLLDFAQGNMWTACFLGSLGCFMKLSPEMSHTAHMNNLLILFES
jgi:hypothetical protein